MLVTEMAKTVTNILKLSPTHFVSNIRHQHRCSRIWWLIGVSWVLFFKPSKMNSLRTISFLKPCSKVKQQTTANREIVDKFCWQVLWTSFVDGNQFFNRIFVTNSKTRPFFEIPSSTCIFGNVLSRLFLDPTRTSFWKDRPFGKFQIRKLKIQVHVQDVWVQVQD